MQRLRRQDGVSLIEVLASLGIFLIVAAGLSVTTLGTIRANRNSRDAAVATALAQDKLEEFRAVDPSDATQLAKLKSGSDVVNSKGGTSSPARFSRSWTVTKDSPKFGTATVKVEVSWTDGSTHKISAVTYVCDTPQCH